MISKIFVVRLFKTEASSVISTLNYKTIKLIKHFKHICSNISSPGSYVNICMQKAWSDLDKLSTIWKSNPSGKIKWISTFVWMYHLNFEKTFKTTRHAEEAGKNLLGNFPNELLFFQIVYFYGYSSVDLPEKTNIHQLLYGHWMQFRGPAKSNGRQEWIARENKEIQAISPTDDDNIYSKSKRH